jgi:hypothetical protein
VVLGKSVLQTFRSVSETLRSASQTFLVIISKDRIIIRILGITCVCVCVCVCVRERERERERERWVMCVICG